MVQLEKEFSFLKNDFARTDFNIRETDTYLHKFLPLQTSNQIGEFIRAGFVPKKGFI